MKKTLYIISELFPPDETSTSYILGEIANACAREYEVHVICGPEVYDTRKALDTEHPFRLHPSVRVLRAQGLGIDKNTSLGKARAFVAIADNTSFAEIEAAVLRIVESFPHFSDAARRRFEGTFYYRNYNEKMKGIIKSLFLEEKMIDV